MFGYWARLPGQCRWLLHAYDWLAAQPGSNSVQTDKQRGGRTRERAAPDQGQCWGWALRASRRRGSGRGRTIAPERASRNATISATVRVVIPLAVRSTQSLKASGKSTSYRQEVAAFRRGDVTDVDLPAERRSVDVDRAATGQPEAA